MILNYLGPCSIQGFSVPKKLENVAGPCPATALQACRSLETINLYNLA